MFVHFVKTKKNTGISNSKETARENSPLAPSAMIFTQKGSKG